MWQSVICDVTVKFVSTGGSVPEVYTKAIATSISYRCFISFEEHEDGRHKDRTIVKESGKMFFALCAYRKHNSLTRTLLN